ncbi:hypothetical protein, partial [Dankookia rubra]|uniref:hypothetical protein n=1 Tax=Dankookia rubra TaxID=1442381 RepID=UPI0019D57714
VDSMARLATVRAAAAPLPSLSSDLDVARVRAGDLPDAASWQEVKVLHPACYYWASQAAAHLAASTTLPAEEPSVDINEAFA